MSARTKVLIPNRGRVVSTWCDRGADGTWTAVAPAAGVVDVGASLVCTEAPSGRLVATAVVSGGTTRQLRGVEDLLGREAAPSVPCSGWAGDDPVASLWGDEVRSFMRAAGRADPRLAAELAACRYLAAALVPMRTATAARFGFAATGATPFGFYRDVWSLDDWLDARDRDGTVRYCPDDAANASLRSALVKLCLDPDRSPRDVVSVPYRPAG